MHRGTNLPRMGDYNQAVVLDLVRRSPDGLSRAQLARRAGLSAQTISNISARLVRDGLVVEAGARARPGPGRPGSLLRIGAGSRYAVGVHLDPAAVTSLVVDIAGTVHATVVRQTDDRPTPDRVVGQIGDMVGEVLDVSAVDPARVLGVGVASPGPIDLARGVISRPPLLVGWPDDVPLRHEVQRVTGLPTVLDKDVSAAAFAHLWFGVGLPAESFVFVYLGAGCAFACVLNREVVRGRTGNAGDVGRLQVDHVGPPDDAGVVGTLGRLVRAAEIVQEGRGAGALDGVEVDLQSHRDVFRAFGVLGRRAEMRGSAADVVLERAIRRVVTGAGDVAHLLEVERVVLGGPLWALWPPHALEQAQSALDDRYGRGASGRIEVSSSPWAQEVGAVGGAGIVFEQTFAPRPAALLLDGTAP